MTTALEDSAWTRQFWLVTFLPPGGAHCRTHEACLGIGPYCVPCERCGKSGGWWDRDREGALYSWLYGFVGGDMCVRACKLAATEGQFTWMGCWERGRAGLIHAHVVVEWMGSVDLRMNQTAVGGWFRTIGVGCQSRLEVVRSPKAVAKYVAKDYGKSRLATDQGWIERRIDGARSATTRTML